MNLPLTKFDLDPSVTLHHCLDVLKRKARLAVIYSGDNSRDGAVVHQTYHPRHWKSYQAVAEDICDTLKATGFRQVVTLEENMNLLDELTNRSIDLVWLNTGGVQGRNAMAHAASLLELAGIPYIGHNPLTYALLDHKLHFKEMLRGYQLPTADFFVWDPVRHYQQFPSFLKAFRKAFAQHDPPWIVKPVNGRGSRYIFPATNENGLREAIEEVYRHTQNAVLIEVFLGGREYCVAGGPRILMQGSEIKLLDNPLAFGCMEKRLRTGELIFQTIDQNPINASRAYLLDPDRERSTVATLKSLCERICHIQSINQLIRLDAREDHMGRVHILEANPKPDLKRPRQGSGSLVALGLAAENLTYEDLLMSLLATGLHHMMHFRPSSIPGLLELFDLKPDPSVPSRMH